MVKRNVRKTSKAGKVVNKMMSEESEEMLLMGSALGEQMMGLLSQVATSRKGMGAAATALAMAWATLKDIASCEGVEIETLFESEVRFYAGAIVEE
jgi:nanoRNase/pAp phosphatase (c-di-AMP/oligoRNAs hydrolase)